ncbi:GNAT domain-containing protein [Pelagophyceae sp. CCMP2097]|nr:GNAT domain-containing protein [Pelagophyceae sp. CCMP2097]
MRLNWDTALIGRHVVLVPYREHYVERYHARNRRIRRAAWMQDEEMLRLTASDKLTLEQEAANCVSWRDDEAKLTFIVLDKALCRCGASTHAEAFPASAMVGDVNVFRDRDDGARGEVEVMIAEAAARGRGCGSEAVRLVMSYARAKMTIKSFFVKIGDGNAASLKLFECLGFAKCNYSEAFKETELELSAARVADAALPLSETTFLAPNSGSAFDVIRFEEQLLDEKFSCAIFLFGEKCAWVWVGKGDDPRMESMCIAAPAACVP